MSDNEHIGFSPILLRDEDGIHYWMKRNIDDRGIVRLTVKRATKAENRHLSKCIVCGSKRSGRCPDLESATDEYGWCHHLVEALNERLKMRKRWEETQPDRRQFNFTFDKLT